MVLICFAISTVLDTCLSAFDPMFSISTAPVSWTYPWLSFSKSDNTMQLSCVMSDGCIRSCMGCLRTMASEDTVEVLGRAYILSIYCYFAASHLLNKTSCSSFTTSSLYILASQRLQFYENFSIDINFLTMSRPHRVNTRTARILRRRSGLAQNDHRAGCDHGCMLSIPPLVGEVVDFYPPEGDCYWPPSGRRLETHFVVVLGQVQTRRNKRSKKRAENKYTCCVVCTVQCPKTNEDSSIDKHRSQHTLWRTHLSFLFEYRPIVTNA